MPPALTAQGETTKGASMGSNLPGYSADRSLASRRANFPLLVQPTKRLEVGIHPAQDRPCAVDRTSPACQDCWGLCISGCDFPRDCFPGCRVECGGQPPAPAPLPCTPTDNSVNQTLCTIGIDAWALAAGAICRSTLGGIPGVGPVLAGACSEAATALAAQMKNDCPPAVICV
jgi:hypothetical protein